MVRSAAVAFVLAAAVSAAGQTGAVSLTLTTKPSPLGLGQNLFDVSVKDAKGQPVANADVSLLLVMPADPKTKHPEMRTEGELNNAGRGRRAQRLPVPDEPGLVVRLETFERGHGVEAGVPGELLPGSQHVVCAVGGGGRDPAARHHRRASARRRLISSLTAPPDL
jgi:hypothetical protein